jgi:hypothetical protein
MLVFACTKTSETTHPAPTIVPEDAATGDATVATSVVPADAASADAGADASVGAATGPAVLASCPKTYAIAAAGTCSLASVDKLACTYPDGHCNCVEFSPCAGWAGAYEEARKHPKAQWGCTPKLRPDGCLGDRPAPGSHCGQNGKECGYASCGGDVLVCRNAAWAIARQIAPPP